MEDDPWSSGVDMRSWHFGPLWPVLVLGCLGTASVVSGAILGNEADELRYLDGVASVPVEGQVLEAGSRFGAPTATVVYDAPPGATRPEDETGNPLPLQQELYAPADTRPGGVVEVLVDPGSALDAVVVGAPVRDHAERLALFSVVAYVLGGLTLLAAAIQVVRVAAASRDIPHEYVQNTGRHQL